MKSKKIIAFVCAITMVGSGTFGCYSSDYSFVRIDAVNAESLEYGHYRYEVKNDEIIITDYCNDSFTSNVYSIVIPEEIEGKKVTSIGEEAFKRSSLKSITIPDSVTEIGDNAFYDCYNLTSITIPESVTNIGRNAFYDSPWLKNKIAENPLVIVNGIIIDAITCEGDVEIPNGVTRIPEEAFECCSDLTSIKIPESVTSIGEHAFYDCAGLKIITIPGSVTSIGDGAFVGCKSLSNITISEGTASIGKSAFANCSGLTSIIIPKSVTSIGEDAFYNCTGLKSITIPGSVTSIENKTFEKCSNLIDVTISKGVTSIGDNAFIDCDKLESVIIQDGVLSIGEMAFCRCYRLKNIIIPESVESIGLGAFYGTKWLTEIKSNSENSMAIVNGILIDAAMCSGDAVIPDGVTSILCSAFANCRGLTSITIPEGVTEIGDDAFYGCSSLTSITIPEGVTEIGNGVFWGCSSLTSITIPESVTSIGDYAFSKCMELTNITIPQSVETIGENAFVESSNTTISGVKGSVAEKYAAENGIAFTPVEGKPDVTDTPVTTVAASTTPLTTTVKSTEVPVTTTAAVTKTEVHVTTVTTPVTSSSVTENDEKSCVVSIGSINGKVGETVKVPISIKNNPGIISVVADMKFDSTALKLKGVEKNKDFWVSAELMPGSDLTAQPYRISCYDALAKTDFKENGTICELSFELLKEGTHEIELTVSENDTINFNLSSVKVNSANGVIKVSDSSETPSVTETPVTTPAAVTTPLSTTTVKSTEVPVTTTAAVTKTEVPVTTVTTPVTSSSVTENDEKSCVVSVGSINGKVGETVKVPISIKNNPGIISVVADMKFDSTALKLKGVEKNKDFWVSAELMPGSDLTAQPYRISCYDALAKTDFKENGTICELSFELVKEGTYEIELTVSENDTINFNLSSVKVNSANGVIKVSDSSETPSVTETPVTTPVGTVTTTPAVTTTAGTVTTTPAVTTTAGTVTTTPAVTTTAGAVTTTPVVTTAPDSPVTEKNVISLSNVSGKPGEIVKVDILCTNFAEDYLINQVGLKILSDGLEFVKFSNPNVPFIASDTLVQFMISLSNSMTVNDFTDDNGVFLSLYYKIPENAETGKSYKIEWADTNSYSYSFGETNDGVYKDEKCTFIGGNVSITDTSEPSVTPTPGTKPESSVTEKNALSFSNVSGKPGETVKVDILCNNFDDDYLINSVMLKILDGELEFVKLSNPLVLCDVKDDAMQLLFAITSPMTVKDYADENGVLFSLYYKIPENAKPGDSYKLEWAKKDSYDYHFENSEVKNDKDCTLINGLITVSDNNNSLKPIETVLKAEKTKSEVFDEKTSALSGASEIKIDIPDRYGFVQSTGNLVDYTFSLSDYKPDVENFEYAAFGLDLPEGFTFEKVALDSVPGSRMRSVLSKAGPSLRRFVLRDLAGDTAAQNSSVSGKVHYAAPGTDECAALDAQAGKSSKDGYIVFSAVDTKNAAGNTDMFTVTLNAPAINKSDVFEIKVLSMFGVYTDKTETAEDGTVTPHVSFIANNEGNILYSEKTAKYITGLRGDVDLDGKVSQIDANVILKEILAHDAGTTVLPAEINMEAAGENSQALSRFLGDIDSSDNGEMFRQTDANAILKAILQADAAGEKEISENTWKKVLDVE